jgi:hypothetical protein
MAELKTNIDAIRLEIMRLENAEVFDQDAWDRLVAELAFHQDLCRLVDLQRRMETVRINQSVSVETEVKA